MDLRIYVLALASFAMGTEAYVYAGHLEALAADLGQPVSATGQIATAFAVTYALSAPLVAGAVARFDRRAVLTVGLGLIALVNLLAAFAPGLTELAALRVAAGIAAGLVGPISSVAAAELAPPEQRGKAMAVVLAGMTLAFILGIPMGSVVGDLAGWRGTFAYAAAMALIAGLAIRIALPAMPGGKRADIATFKAALAPVILRNLALTAVGFAATFATIAYVGPVVTAISGLTGSGIGAMQALIGVGSIIVIGARTADKPGAGRLLVASFLVSALGLSLYSILLLGTIVDAAAPILSWPRLGVILALSFGMIGGAAALFARTPVIQARLVGASPADARSVVMALNGSMVFLGQGLGAGLGGLTIATGGLAYVGVTAAAVALLGAWLASRMTPKVTAAPTPAQPA
jgi:MFS transporter, DHA1 family, inner membrane transport protein